MCFEIIGLERVTMKNTVSTRYRGRVECMECGKMVGVDRAGRYYSHFGDHPPELCSKSGKLAANFNGPTKIRADKVSPAKNRTTGEVSLHNTIPMDDYEINSNSIRGVPGGIPGSNRRH